MKLNPFTSDAGLLTQEEMTYIENKVVESVYYQAVARDLFPVVALGQNGGVETYHYYDEELGAEAQISMTGKAATTDHPEKTRNDVKIPVISRTGFINWRNYESSKRQGMTLIDDVIRGATRRITEAEDRMLISGEYTGWAAEGVEGLFGKTGRTDNASAGAWPANAVADINVARAALAASGYNNVKPTVVGTPAILQTLDAFMANTETTYRQALLNSNLVADFVETPNAYAQDGGQDSVVCVVPGPENFVAVQDLPLTVITKFDDSNNVMITIRETISPLIKHAESIAEINSIT